MKITCTAIAATVILGFTGCATNVSTPETVRQSDQTTKNQMPTKTKKGKKTTGTDYESVKSKVKFLHDPHIGARTATAPEIKYLDPNRNKWVDGYNIYHLIGIDVGRSGDDTINFSDVQLRIEQTTQGDWPNYSAAYSMGRRLDFTKVDSDVNCLSYGGGCYKKEIVGVDMTMDQLREISERPTFTLKIVGKRNNMIIEMPQSYIKGFLAAVDNKEATH